MANETPLKQLTDKIKSVNNILVTVSCNPSVDQLASALGLSLALNKLGKRSVAVFSGKIPPAIKFLEPEKTFESNADSLRDFIISLSKDKADRLQVKPEGDFVKVYITPYRTKITPKDLKFTDGNFNVELIIAIGVSSRDELDASIASHGKIFHDAITATLNLEQLHDALGMISWQDGRSGCYAEMCYSLIDNLAGGNRSLVNEPIATALLTGVVAATDQFRNSVTSPSIMTLSANLMAKGANQQLITSELENARDETAGNNDGYARAVKGVEVPSRRNDEVVFNRNDDQSGNGPAKVVDLDNDVVERRLNEDREKLGREQSDEALKATQGQLLDVSGAITGGPAEQRIQAPEAPTTESNTAPSVTAVPAVTPSTTVSNPELAPVAPVPIPAPSAPADNSAAYLTTPAAEASNLAPTGLDGTGLPSSSGSYIINDDNDLPFNMPNQVSPIQPVAPQPASEPTMPLPPMPQAEPTLSMPMPPVPPAPVNPLTAPAMPPVSEPVVNTATATPVMSSVSPTPVSAPTTESTTLPSNPAVTPAPADPGQFVIPS